MIIHRECAKPSQFFYKRSNGKILRGKIGGKRGVGFFPSRLRFREK